MKKFAKFTALFILCAGIISCTKKQDARTDGKVQIEWWHSMAGHNGEVVDELVKKFNESQDKYIVKATYRGIYDEALNALVAAFRGNKQPDIAQIYEAGNLQMMKSNAIIPVHKLLEENGYNVDWSTFLDPVRSYYWDENKNLVSMPFNTSTPLMYLNKERMKAAGLTSAPKTWEELFAFLDKDVKAGNKCGLTVSWPTWILVENFTAIHDKPFATKSNGFGGVDTELVYSHPEVISLFKSLDQRLKTGAFAYDGRGSDAARNGFISGKCSVMMESTSALKAISKSAEFEWEAAMLPHLKDAKTVKNAIIGGATLWVLKGKPKENYAATAAFLNFLSEPEQQMWWHKSTGYVPISKTAYEMLKKEGFYEKNPGAEVAIKQLLRGGEPSENSQGLRLGMFPQIREVMVDEMEKIYADKVSVEEGFKTAQDRGNQILRRFEKTVTQ